MARRNGYKGLNAHTLSTQELADDILLARLLLELVARGRPIDATDLGIALHGLRKTELQLDILLDQERMAYLVASRAPAGG